MPFIERARKEFDKVGYTLKLVDLLKEIGVKPENLWNIEYKGGKE